MCLLCWLALLYVVLFRCLVSCGVVLFAVRVGCCLCESCVICCMCCVAVLWLCVVVLLC